jgi:uncharacterized protein YijF (DUF1287 family)
MDKGTIIPARSVAFDKLRTDLANWPERWAIEHSDVAIGHRIVESVRPFLANLLQQGLADKTLARHLDHLQMLGGEIIRRRQNDPDLAKQPVGDLLFDFVEEDGGPLIWPRVTESAQNAFDATCRKLHRFLNQHKDSS